MKIWQIRDRPKSLVLSDAELIAALSIAEQEAKYK